MLLNQRKERSGNFNFGAYHTLEEVGISKRVSEKQASLFPEENATSTWWFDNLDIRLLLLPSFFKFPSDFTGSACLARELKSSCPSKQPHSYFGGVQNVLSESTNSSFTLSHNTPLLIFKLHGLQSHSRAMINYGLGGIRATLSLQAPTPTRVSGSFQIALWSKVTGWPSLVSASLGLPSFSFFHLGHVLLCSCAEPFWKLVQIYLSALSPWGWAAIQEFRGEAQNRRRVRAH